MKAVGRIDVDKVAMTHQELESKYARNFSANCGGHWKPLKCLAHSKVAIIVPYRDRDMHLRVFLNHMHSFLNKQSIDYAIYIIEEVYIAILY